MAMKLYGVVACVPSTDTIAPVSAMAPPLALLLVALMLALSVMTTL
jgi:hypothetical protein